MKKWSLLIGCLCSVQCIVAQGVFDSIMSNIQNVQWNNIQNAVSLDFERSNINNYESLARNVKKIESAQLPDGHWSDIVYSLRTQTAWLPTQHLVRLHKMVLAYTIPNGKLKNNKELYQGILKGLQYWYDRDSRSTNWWYQQIFCPKQIGEMLILMRVGEDKIPKALEDSLFSRMVKISGEPNGRYSEGSANRVNISLHWIYRGCLTGNLAVLEEGVKNALLPVKFNTPGRGVQYDLSYQEHGRQLYIGNYGHAFVDNIASMALFLRNTRYALSGMELSLFSQFVRYTYLPAIRGKYYSFSIPGRQVANEGELDRSKTTEILNKMQLVDPQYADVYRDAEQRWLGSRNADYKINKAHTQYWISDYTTHIRPDYSFDVRFVSDRTVRTENINNEDKKGFFLSDGATNMTIKGDEYFNTFPVWDWCKVPGVTAPQYDSLPDMRVDVGGDKGITAFCGGVTDSVYGVSCYDMDNERFQTKAKKSWFFFDKEIVCLGADIQSENEQPIATTINQCLSKGTVTINRKNYTSLFEHIQLNGVKENAIVHNGFGYYFPQGGNISVSNRIQTGNWHTISVSQKDRIVSDSVFSRWINHGIKPHDASYSYIVFPNIYSSTDMAKTISSEKITILKNTKSIQAVYNAKLQQLQVVFYEGGQSLDFSTDFRISVDKPCVVLLKRQDGHWALHVSDPSQSLSVVNIQMQNKTDKTNYKTAITFPRGTDAGRSVKFVFP